MSSPGVFVTGLGSVTTLGPLRGPIASREARLREITGWPARSGARAFVVPPFRPATVAPGIKTRRLGRLSVWALVATWLALEDAGLALAAEDPRRLAVVAGTGLGCLDLTEEFMTSVATHGFAQADPILFPETLCNSPAGHVARQFGLRGPNLTLSCRGVSGEAALIQACGLLEHGECDAALVIAGDLLSRTLWEWYEAASVLAGGCFAEGAASGRAGRGFIPGEGLAAAVLETAESCHRRGARIYARYRAGGLGHDPSASSLSWGTSSQPTVRLMRQALAGPAAPPVQLICRAANGLVAVDSVEQEAIDEVFGSAAPQSLSPKRWLGEFEGNAIVRLAAALAEAPPAAPGLALLLGASAGGGRAAVSVEIGGDRP